MRGALFRVISFLIVILLVLFSFSSCYHEEFHSTDISDYPKAFETEYRAPEGVAFIFPSIQGEDSESFLFYCEYYGFEEQYRQSITPPKINDLNVIAFYCSWNLSFVGSASVELLLSVKFDQMEFQKEVQRLSSIQGYRMMEYNTDAFTMPAYVASLGHNQTNQYVLVDEEHMTLHYIHLQLRYKEELQGIDDTLLPKYYSNLGDVTQSDFSIFSK